MNILQADHSGLTIEQWNRLSNLVHCYEEHSGVVACRQFIVEQEGLPPKFRYKFQLVGDCMLKTMSGGEQLFKNNQDLLSLCSQDRATLRRMTFEHVSAMLGNLVQYQTGLLDNPAIYRSAELCYGTETIALGKSVQSQIDFDLTFLKLMLALLTFSTFTYTTLANPSMSILTNLKAILAIQNEYAEIAWRYLVYKYGHEQSVQYFCRFIRFIFTLHDCIVAANESKHYTDDFNPLVEESDHNLNMTN